MIHTDFKGEKISQLGMGTMRLPVINGVDKDIDEYADESARNTDIRKSTDRIYDNSGKNCITQLSEGVPDF